MKFRDYHFLIANTGLVTLLSFLFSGSFEFAGEMLAASLFVGGIIVCIRRSIITARRKYNEKKQAV